MNARCHALWRTKLRRYPGAAAAAAAAATVD